VQLGTHVSNARAHIFKVAHDRVIMHQQDVQAVSVVNTCKAYGHAFTVQLQYDYSATPVLCITHLAMLQCQVT
jgi:hypothetical protein